MKLEELQEWIKNHEHVTHELDWYDSNGNHIESRVYKDKEDKFWLLEFMNESPYRRWGNTFIEDDYFEPIEVFKTTKTIECYEPKK